MQGSTFFVVTCFGLLPPALGHGLLTFPPLRGGTAGRSETAYCPHCGNGAGVCGDGGQWGTGSDLLNFARGPVTSLGAGEVVEFQVRVTAHHRGFFEFRICDQHLDGSVANPEACLNEHKLRRAPPPADCTLSDPREDVCQPLDTRHPERWYLPPMRNGGLYSMRYAIPADLRCTSCTLQWQWFTANSCLPGADTGCYWADFAAQGWDKTAWCGTFCGECGSSAQMCASGAGEEFRNCADIAVVGKTGGATPKPDGETQVEQELEPDVEPEVHETSPSPPPSMSQCGSCSGCMWANGFCCADATKESCESLSDNVWCGASLANAEGAAPTEPHELEPDVEPEVHETSPSSSPSKPSSECGSCNACMLTNGFCYPYPEKKYCELVPGSVWCGASLAQVKQHRTRFLGLGLIQDGAASSRSVIGEEL